MPERRLFLQQVTKRLGRTRVLRGASLHVVPGRVLGVIGANGSGKTTLLRIMLGLIRPDSGQVVVNGFEPAVAATKFPVAYFGGGRTLPSSARVGQWARLFARSGPLCSDRRPIATLWRGQRQLVGLQSALGQQVLELVVLDEPWDGLDPRGAGWLSRRITECRHREAIVVLSSHRLGELAGVCDVFAFLHRGRLTTYDGDRFRDPGAPIADRLRATYLSVTGGGATS